VRLRMYSSDVLCPRSMEVSWDDGTGVRSVWTSWTENGPESGCFEAEKLLPSSVTDLRVCFRIHCPGGPWDVCKIDRLRDNSWVTNVEGGYEKEVISLRAREDEEREPIDAVFELRGAARSCYVWRAWNATWTTRRKQWECWTDTTSRPVPEAHCPTLEAADGAAPIAIALGNPMTFYICTTKRLVAAAHALVDVHRDTLKGLKALDSSFTNQWLGVNVGNTASAGLGIASAVLLFAAPPVGVGLGIGSAVTGGLTFAGDSIADRTHLQNLRKQISRDEWNSFVVSGLVFEWVQARQALGASSWGSGLDQMGKACSENRQRTVSLGGAVDGTLTAGSVSQSSAGVATRLASSMADLGKTAAVASQILGVAGALLSTGFAVRGWSSTKALQASVRERCKELRLRIIRMQHMLAAVDRLECPICADEITLADSVRRCTCDLHCFHASCLRPYERSNGLPPCHLCGAPFEAEIDVMVDSLERQTRVGRPRNAGGF